VIVKKRGFLLLFIGILLAVSGCSDQTDHSKQTSNQGKGQNVKSGAPFQIIPAKNQKVGQIRGIGYPGNDTALYVATNDGMLHYLNSKWLETTKDKHNYMSLQATDSGFLASGHPEKGSGLKDPLGLVESADQGKSLKKLAFYGKGNFHFVAASFSGKGMYIIMEQQLGKLDPGVYFAKSNDGQNWDKSKLAGFTADSLGMMAVHPQNGSIVAMATRTGVYYSENYANSMTAITGPVMVTALTFSGDNIIYSSVEDNKILLKKVNPKTGQQSDIVFPFLDYDNPVTYLSVNPKDENQIAFSTYKNDLYQSKDGGKSWNSLLTDGRIEQDYSLLYFIGPGSLS
jgi:hypothetical protein